MCNLTLDKVKGLIDTFDAPLLISIYKRSDELNREFKELIGDTYSDVKNKYNFISLDVSDMEEFCSEYRLSTPRTVLFLNKEVKYVFTEYAGLDYIESMVSMMCGGDAPMRIGRICSPIHLEDEEEEEIVF